MPDPRPRRPRRSLPGVERLDLRAIPSVIPMLLQAKSTIRAADLPEGSTPRPHEVRRQAFFAQYPARFYTGVGRFTDQKFQTFHQGEQKGQSNFFLVSEITMATVQPTDPGQPVTGQVYMFDRNASNTGNVLVLDLVNDGPLDKFGRPRRMTWTVNDSSGGSFQQATGQGTLRIQYKPGGKTTAQVLDTGRSLLTFRGSVYTTNLSTLLRF
ncbi:MAG: hypothetical protein U0800_13935 [Isosphaeraceae bacterium]